jgi:rod shape-determining protein MreD
MRLLLTATFTATALLLQPVADQAFGDFAVRPNLYLAPLAIAVSLCPGAAAVVWCGILGLILDCLSGPQMGARSACLCLLAALGSFAMGGRTNSWPRRLATWGAILFAAEMFSRIVQYSSVGGPFHPAAAVADSALSAMATTALLSGLWLLGQFPWRRPRPSRSIHRFSLAIGRSANGD